MSEHQQAIERAYDEAKRGNWDQVLLMWRQHPRLAQECSRYQKSLLGGHFCIRLPTLATRQHVAS
jgi:hypothetical protein